MKKVILVWLGAFLILGSSNALGFSWVYHGHYSGDVSSGLSVGTDRTGDGENDTQSIQISGAGTLLPSGYPGWATSCHFNGSTWDSYNAPGSGNTGYFDVFAVVLSEDGYYWNLTNTSIHPLEDNPQLILATPDPTNSYWGGESYGDGILDSEDTDVTLAFNTDPTKQYYLTFFLQTMSDNDYPSWGTISDVEVYPVPEPASILLLGCGLVGLGWFRRKKSL